MSRDDPNYSFPQEFRRDNSNPLKNYFGGEIFYSTGENMDYALCLYDKESIAYFIFLKGINMSEEQHIENFSKMKNQIKDSGLEADIDKFVRENLGLSNFNSSLLGDIIYDDTRPSIRCLRVNLPYSKDLKEKYCSCFLA